MRPNTHVLQQERGVALVMAMLVLLVLAVFSAILMMTVSTQSKITGNDSRRQRALNLAEAGISEAIIQLNKGYVSVNTANPRAVTQIFNVAAGSVPVLGTDSSGTYTRQPAGAYLGYTTTAKSPDALTIRFKTNPGRSVIYKYDSSRSPAVNTVSGLPILEIESTGKVGTTTRTIVAEVVARPPTFNAKGAMTAGGQMNLHQGIMCCGNNHSATTPDFTSITAGRSAAAGANPGATAQLTSCLAYENHVGDMAGAWAGGTAAYDVGQAPGPWGSPPKIGNQSGKYTGCWDALGMTQASFVQWLPPRRTTLPTNWNGSFYLDKDATLNNGANSWTLSNVNGSGFLYVEGHVTITGDFIWRGLVYVNGQLETQGRMWVLGAFIGDGAVEMQGTSQSATAGSGAILYSKDAVDLYISMYAGQYQRVAWHELD